MPAGRDISVIIEEGISGAGIDEKDCANSGPIDGPIEEAIEVSAPILATEAETDGAAIVSGLTMRGSYHNFMPVS
ncbi:hypothetical protein A2870_01085 [Candidatus Curtissbacteria bacterium RIFCSPHIGHO2_01_FULL_41_11]|uniref:Uncharacterized protein n=1 Tax=Candidatus Curtissbacteria bacterium RIFCSPHIGHO2_01_FULL_41_11 TaxID=1797711 RepID=A0A1F5G8E3_9BACT|nr:MAG: hypothetical protein A2870_01085 [Candidatus Curtissbacteria bacterium RIFCSPHIGHO2_01_FULL_41_11]